MLRSSVHSCLNAAMPCRLDRPEPARDRHTACSAFTPRKLRSGPACSSTTLGPASGASASGTSASDASASGASAFTPGTITASGAVASGAAASGAAASDSTCRAAAASSAIASASDTSAATSAESGRSSMETTFQSVSILGF